MKIFVVLYIVFHIINFLTITSSRGVFFDHTHFLAVLFCRNIRKSSFIIRDSQHPNVLCKFGFSRTSTVHWIYFRSSLVLREKTLRDEWKKEHDICILSSPLFLIVLFLIFNINLFFFLLLCSGEVNIAHAKNKRVHTRSRFIFPSEVLRELTT